jgi:hypothetical protein
VFLWHVFLIKPLAACSIIICLATIFACFRLERTRPQQKSDRFLIAFLGLLAIYQAMRILETAGVLSMSVNSKLDDAIELMVAMFYLIAALLLRFSSVNRLDAESAFRLVRAAPPRQSPDGTAKDLQVPKTSLALDGLAWALPRLTDGAFKLYAYLYVSADAAGRAIVIDRDLQLRMKRSPNELEGYCTELEQAGAATIHRDGGRLEVKIGQGAALPTAQLSGALSGSTAI